MKPWATGEEPRLSADPDMKQAAAPADAAPGVTVAGKGEVTGPDQRPKSPAERLALTGPKRVKAEKCLANAVYFEARSEPVRGQIAVAQVVMNRAFSGFYPERRLRRRLSERAPPSRLPVHLRVRRHPRRGQRPGLLGTRQAHLGRNPRRQAVAARDRQVDALSRVLCQSLLGARDEEARQDRPASLLSSAQMGEGDEAPSWGNAIYTADAAAKM
jgi:hypothetical protein